MKLSNLLVVIGAIAPVVAHATPPMPPGPPPKSITGQYVIQGKPSSIVEVRSIGIPFYQIECIPEGWTGVGVLDGKTYIGVFRQGPVGAKSVNDSGFVVGRHTIDWSFPNEPLETRSIAGRAEYQTRWNRQAPPQSKPNPPADPDRPAFGEYVQVDELPEAITKVPPAFPDGPRPASGFEGTVLVQALVLKDGTVGDTKIVKSLPGFDDAAMTAVRQWKFKPAMAKGNPVAVWVAVPVKFSVH